MRKLLCTLLVLYLNLPCDASIVFPAFDTPLIHDGKLYAHHTYDHEIICLELSDKSIKWRVELDKEISSIFLGLTNEIIVDHSGGGGLSIIDANTGEIKEKHLLKGRVFGIGKNGEVFYEDWEALRIFCYAYKNKEFLWTFDPKTPNSHIPSVLCGEYVFIFVRPSGITISYEDWKEVTKITKGRNEIICLKASDGSLVWREKVPLSKFGFGVHGHVKESGKYLLCVSDNAIRLLDKTSAEELKRYESSIDIDGADFWGDECIVTCLGGSGKASKTIRVIDITDFRVLSEFKVWKRELASVESVGDILLLGSLYREIGVDLVKKKTIWTAYHRHQTVHNGLIYYGEYNYDEDTENEHKILGVCNPITGDNEILYSELISYTKVKPYHIFTAVGVILVIGTLTMFLLKTKKRHT